jgi:hypothetical protein
VQPSMGSIGDAYDGAMCESVFATLECELFERRKFPIKAEAGWRSSSSSRAGTTPVAAIRRFAFSQPSLQTEHPAAARVPKPMTVHETGAIPTTFPYRADSCQYAARQPAQGALAPTA